MSSSGWACRWIRSKRWPGSDQTTRHQCCRSRHKPVHQHHAPLARGLQHRAGHHGDFKPAHGGQRVQWLDRFAVPAGRGEELLQLVFQPGLVRAGADSTGVAQWHPAQARQQQRSAGGVGHADIAEGEHVAGQVLHHVHACFQRGNGLRNRHGRTQHHVAGAVTDLAQQERDLRRGIAGHQDVRGHTRVHHRQLETLLLGQAVDQ